MTPQAQLVLLLWLPVILYLFRRYPPRTAVMLSFLGGLLFLPQRTGFALPLIPDYQGMVATCYGIVLGLCLYDRERLKKLRVEWLDLPMALWCISPFLSSITNGLGAYDGVNESITQTVVWGLPYMLGKLYFNRLIYLKQLAESIIKGGLIYVPLTLWEGRMSPNLHLIVYGYYAHPSGISQAIRYGGYRPNVFMQHGLMVGMWMMTVALITIWLWQSKTLTKIWNYEIKSLVPVLVFTVIWCRSTGAYGYFFYGLIILFTAKFLKSNLPLLLLIFGIGWFLYMNVTGQFHGDKILAFLGEYINPDRIQSLGFRWLNEEILAEKARQRFLFGWAGWNRNRVYEENWIGEIVDVSVTDSLWIIAFGIYGAFGLLNLTLSLLLPPTVFATFRYPAKLWLHPKVAPAAALATCLVLFMLDSVINNMYNPIFPLISGSLSGLCLQPVESLKTKPSGSKTLAKTKKPVTKKLQRAKPKKTLGKLKRRRIKTKTSR
ncbi:O-antigen ligase domain-containing protein [Synechocystis salina LEGE 06155]|nr:O-antigen ligase domain-containing protein [Synechocystis salina LEGE 06155]